MAELIRCGESEVVVGHGLPEPLLHFREQRRRAAVLTQPAATAHALEVATRLRAEGLASEIIGLPDREEAKTLEVARSVYEAFADQDLTVHDTVVAVGGGSVTDLAGFVAGTWLRGVEAVNVPTTFLAAVDAAIGGKTGVNLGGKNLVGVFWQPSRVLIDLDLMMALPPALVREGMAEALKAGMVGDADLAALLTAKGLDAPLEEVVARAIRVKARLVEADPRDRGVRHHLNFGHTIGHALEYASTLSHGESVSLGMIAAARISETRVGFGGTAELVDTLAGLGLPMVARGLDRQRVVDLVHRDKKRDADGLRMVLLEEVGRPVVVSVGAEDLAAGLAAIGL